MALGPERKSSILSEREKKIVAYHEAGHALLASTLPYADPVQKISIISRGHAGGYVLSLPDEDRKLKTRREYMDDITMALGGFVAEKIIFGDVTTGPSSDLIKITEIAHNMVTRWGMSEKLGPFVVRRMNPSTATKEEHAEKIEEIVDSEVKSIIKIAEEKAMSILNENVKVLHALVEKLLEVETLERKEYEDFLALHGVEIQNALGK